MVRLSIIIPVFNMELFLRRCLLSIVEGQKELTDYEVICVDDGSTDGSAGIVNEMCLLYPQISLFKQKNEGVSSARNKGLDLARGKYIMFIDPDDFFAPNSLSKLLTKLEKDNLDLITFSFDRTESNCLPEVHSLNSTRYFQTELYKTINFPPFCWAYVYSKEKIGNTRFLQHLRVGEDCVFVETICLKVDWIEVVTDKIYGYYTNPSSVMNRKYDYNANLEFANAYYVGLIELIKLYDSVINPEIEKYLPHRLEYRFFYFLKRLKDRKVPLPIVKRYMKELNLSFGAIVQSDFKTIAWLIRTWVLNNKLLLFVSYKMRSRIII